MTVPNAGVTVRNLLLIASLLSLALIVYALFLPHLNEQFDNEAALNFSSGWKYEAADGSVQEVTFPTALAPNIPGGIRLTNTIPENSDVRINSIAKYCVFQHYRIYVGDERVVDTDDPWLLARHFDKTSGSYWMLQRLPADCAGKKITMEITSAYPDYQQATGTVYLGTKASILFAILRECLGNFIIAIVMMLLGLFFCLLYLFGRKHSLIAVSCIYIGKLMFWIGAWELSESGMLQFVTGNMTFGTVLSFMAMRMGAIALLVYYLSVAGRRFRRYNLVLLCALTVEAVVSAVLQLAQICDFYESVRICHVLLAVVMLSLVAETLLETLHFHNRELRYLLLSMSLVAAAAVCELAYFYLANGTHLGRFLNLGLIAFTVSVSIYELRMVFKNLALAKKAAYFRQLAATDPLTGLANRAALREWFDAREALPPGEKESLAVIVCDVDRLKRINDSCGHQTGDHAICMTASYMQEVFAKNALCCRTGGDEFTCVLEGCAPVETKLFCERFLAAVAEADADLPFDFSVSIGYAYFNALLDKDLHNTVFRADQQMYRMKRRTDPAPAPDMA